jgi:hypothetical protein
MADWKTSGKNCQTFMAKLANNYGKNNKKRIIIRRIIVAIGVCHANSAKADLRHHTDSQWKKEHTL